MKAAKKSPRFRSLPLVVLAVVAVLGAAFWAGAQAVNPSYKRFVSQPLPDGSRFTFLYPARLSHAQQEPARPELGLTQIVSIKAGQTRSRWDKVRRLLAQVGLLQEREQEYVYASAGPLQAKWRVARDKRWQQDWQGFGVVNRHVYLRDARTDMQITLTHSRQRNKKGRVAPNDPVITNSLAVLAPGAPVPTP